MLCPEIAMRHFFVSLALLTFAFAVRAEEMTRISVASDGRSAMR
jgi:hypothetical protein